MITTVICLLLILSLSDSYMIEPVRSSMLNKFTSKHSFSRLFAKRRTTLSRGRTAELPKETAEIIIADSIISPVVIQKEESLIKSISAAATTANYEGSVNLETAAPSNKGRQLSQRIQDDISDFERIGALREKKTVVEENAVAKTLKNIFSAIFIADFFVVIVFLVWFLAAAAMQSTNPFLLERFQVTFHSNDCSF